MKLDIRVENHGSICLLRPLTRAGQRWYRENLLPTAESWQQWGGALAVEPRYVADIVLGAREDGLEVA